MITALDDVLEDFSMYLRVEKRVSEGVAKNYCYTIGKFVRWADTLSPEKKDAVRYCDALLKGEGDSDEGRSHLYQSRDW